MIIQVFNILLIIFITILTYKYFDLYNKINQTSNNYLNYFKCFSRIADRAESYQNSHATVIASEAEKIAISLKLSREDIEILKISCYMHDIGILLLPEDLVSKEAILNKEEIELMRTHPIVGELQLTEVSSDKDEVPTLIRWHHERWDGTGYPDGLMGSETPLLARIISLADAISAMREDRPYRSALDEEGVQRELVRMSGLQFDPELIDIWLNNQKISATGIEK